MGEKRYFALNEISSQNERFFARGSLSAGPRAAASSRMIDACRSSWQEPSTGSVGDVGDPGSTCCSISTCCSFGAAYLRRDGGLGRWHDGERAIRVHAPV